MAGIEIPAELQKKIDEIGPVDLVVGVTGSVDADALRVKAASLRGLTRDGESPPPVKMVVAYAGAPGAEPVSVPTDGILLVAYPPPAAAGSLTFWVDVASAQRRVLELAGAWQARACMVVYNDLTALDTETLRLFTEPVLKGNIDLVMPVYPAGKYDGLINKSLLAPLSRALYGRRVRWPLPADFCVGANMLAKLTEKGVAHAQNEPQLLWPSNSVAMHGGQINQATVKALHAAPVDGLDLNAVLTELAGSLFQEAEVCAAHWQRVRASQAVMRYGDPCSPVENAEPVDPRPMVESFVIGSRNLEEVWRLVLPPATMLELKRLARLEVEQFRMPDALWARIIYDFALAYRMRRISRTHLLGALTPLYLGWVASYTQEVGGATAQEAERRVEQLARMFEEQKPYFVSRWRWPERVS
ncbi:MAG: hypothetical protein WA634_16370 [Silvibacterium sp.]